MTGRLLTNVSNKDILGDIYSNLAYSVHTLKISNITASHKAITETQPSLYFQIQI